MSGFGREQRQYENKAVIELTDRLFGVGIDDTSYNFPLSDLIKFLNLNLDIPGASGDLDRRVIDYGTTPTSIVDQTNQRDPIIINGNDLLYFQRTDPSLGLEIAVFVGVDGTYGNGETQLTDDDILIIRQGFDSGTVNHDLTLNYVASEHVSPDTISLVIEGGVLVVKQVNGHTVESDVPAGAIFTDTQNPLSDNPTLNDSGTAASTVATTVLNTNIQDHINNTNNPHNVLATQITDFQTQVSLNTDVVSNTAYRNVGHIPLTQRGVANGVATLDANGLVPTSQLPNFLQADWDETDALSGAFIQNKPSDVTDLSIHTTDELTEGLTNLYYTNARVSLNTDVQANVTYRNIGHIPLSQKGAIDGVAPLNSSGIVDSIYLPSFVDEIQEFPNFASFPATGEDDVIYLALDSGLTYRWGGTVYVLVSPSDVTSVFGRAGAVLAVMGDYTTGLVPESDGFLYFTTARGRAAISVTGDLLYNQSTGVINYTTPTNVSTFANDAGYLTAGDAVDIPSAQTITGIKTFTPQQIFTNSIRIPLSPTDGYVFTTDAAGNGTWQAPTGGHDAVTISGQNYLSLTGQNINALQINLTSHVTGILPIANGGTGISNFDVTNIARTTGTSAQFIKGDGSFDSNTYAQTSQLHDAVTIAGENYATLSGQQITFNNINLATNVTGTLADGSLSSNVALLNAANVFTNTDFNTFIGRVRVQNGVGLSLLVGADVNARTITNNTRKFARIGMPHYSTSALDIGLFILDSDINSNVINFGGGSVATNAATRLNFLTASTTTTPGGDVRMSITNEGRVGIGIAEPTQALDAVGNITTSGEYQIGGTSINTAGTLSNVAYLNQANVFTAFQFINRSTPRFYLTDTSNANKEWRFQNSNSILSFVEDGVTRAGIPSGGGFNVGGTTVIDSSRNITAGNGVFTGSSFPVIDLTRETTLPSSISSGFRMLTKTSSDMVDGFGGGVVFSIEDATSGLQNIGRIASVRNGSDTSGKLQFQVNSSLTNILEIDDGGIDVTGSGTFSGNGTSILLQNTSTGLVDSGSIRFKEESGGPDRFTIQHDGSANTLSIDTESVSGALSIARTNGNITCVSTVTATNVFRKATQTLSGTSPTYNCSTSVNARITLTGNTTMTLTNLVDGMSGNIRVTQDSTGGRTLTLSPTPDVINGGGGTITLTGTANSVDIISWWYDGTNLNVTYGQNYS